MQGLKVDWDNRVLIEGDYKDLIMELMDIIDLCIEEEMDRYKDAVDEEDKAEYKKIIDLLEKWKKDLIGLKSFEEVIEYIKEHEDIEEFPISLIDGEKAVIIGRKEYDYMPPLLIPEFVIIKD